LAQADYCDVCDHPPLIMTSLARATRRLHVSDDAENPAQKAGAKDLAPGKRSALTDLSNITGLAGKPRAPKDTAPKDTAPKVELVQAVKVDPFAWAQKLPLIDRGDAENPQKVAEYAADVFTYLKAREGVQALKIPDYMGNQEDVTEKMRMILVDWLVEVHWKFKLSPDTLFLTINLLDRYLSKCSVRRTKLQLVGVTCMLIASKHEEIYPPEIKDFVHVTDKAYSKTEILDMEVSVLNGLKFQITTPSPLYFLQRMVKLQECSPEHVSLAQYLLELTLGHYRSVRHPPSHLAAAALFLANKIMKISPAWKPELAEQTEYAESQIKGCAKEMCALLQAAEKASLQAVRKKFSQTQFNRVAKMVA